MDQNGVEQALGSWLIEEYDCRKTSYSKGYTTNPSISHPKFEFPVQPAVVGIKYVLHNDEPTKAPYADFHHYVIDVVDPASPTGIDETIGTLERVELFARHRGLAADQLTLFVATTDEQPPRELREFAKTEGFGLLAIDVHEGRVTAIHQRLAPNPRDPMAGTGFSRSDVLSNRCQRSPGPFADAVAETAILSKVIDNAEQFYYEHIKPAQDDNKARRAYERVAEERLRNSDAKRALTRLLEDLEGRHDLTIKAGDRKLILQQGDEPCLEIRVTDKYFNVDPSNDDHVFRIHGIERIEPINVDISFSDFSAFGTFLSDIYFE